MGARVIPGPGWRQPHGDGIPDDMWFIDEPPGEIGEVLCAWTNHRAGGPAPPPLGDRLQRLGLGAMGGLVVGLVACFVVGGLLEHYHVAKVTGGQFLLSVFGGALLGAALAAALALRAPGTRTLFVGSEGWAEVSGRGGRRERSVTRFADVESIHTQDKVTAYGGIQVAMREVHLRPRGGAPRLWTVTRVAAEAGRDDPQLHFVEAVLRAFTAYRERQA